MYNISDDVFDDTQPVLVVKCIDVYAPPTKILCILKIASSYYYIIYLNYIIRSYSQVHSVHVCLCVYVELLLLYL